MAFRDTKGPLPQGEDMRMRVLEKTSPRTGHLEDKNLDLDARTMALLGKRQRLNVRNKIPLSLSRNQCLIAKIAKFRPRLLNRLLYHIDRILGVFC